MKPLNILLKVSAGALLSHPTFPASAWNNFSRKAYVEPIVVRDGFHDFVLMGAPDYAEMQKLAAWATAEQAKREEPPIGSPDIGIVAAALGQMAKIGVPARPVYQMKCPACSGRGYDTSGSVSPERPRRLRPLPRQDHHRHRLPLQCGRQDHLPARDALLIHDHIWLTATEFSRLIPSPPPAASETRRC
jgi:hypothetical protein